jgi:sialate O-acetylesterase
MKLPSALLTLIVSATALLRADVTLSPIIGSHMVLQRDAACPIWGWADAGEEVTVEFAGQKQTAKPDANGKWMVKLTPLKASAEGRELTIRGKNTLKLDDVVVGEVWLCSGQSNMEWNVGGTQNAKEEIAAATDGLIRHIKVENQPAEKPVAKVESRGGWQAASPQTVAGFTAVGFFFARELRKELNVPVGLLGSNWGGTRIEPWTTPSGFKQVPALKDIADKLDQYPGTDPGKNGEPPKAKLQAPLALYNGRIAPLVPYAMRGALWYQGESNNGEGMLYFEKMKALIAGWRELWQMPDMPFYYVQLAPFIYGGANPENLARIWEAQTAALKIPNTGMAVITDISTIKDIHPRNKQEVGRRLSLWALAKTYGKSGLAYSGPLYKDAKFDGGKATISFQFGDGLKSRDGQALTRFELAGEDKNFVPAKAEISGDKVVVSADGVAKAVAVRFGWSHDAEPNLCNGANLPASPFRTDDWPVSAPKPKTAEAPAASK